MKTNIVLIAAICLFSITSCEKKEEEKKEIDYAILHGTIKNLGDLKVFLFDNPDVNGPIAVNPDGTFTDTLHLSQSSYVKLRAGYSTIDMFLSQGDELTFTTDIASQDSPTVFTGESATIQQYIMAKNEEQTTLMQDYELFFGQEPETFISDINSLKERQIKILESSAFSEAFKKTELKALTLYNMNLKMHYVSNQKYLAGGDDSMIPDGFLDDVEALNKDNDANARQYNSMYLEIVTNDLMNTLETKQDTVTPFLEGIVNELENYKSPTIKNHVISSMLFAFSPSEGDIHIMKDRLLALVSDQKLEESITARYDVIKALIKGQPSPAFTYENFKGGETALNDLKGKYVYIDVWATWCGPCIGEIPYLKELEHKYEDKNIEFVSISVDTKDDYTKWRKMVTNKELGGTQLITENAFNSDFIERYAINAIPRFIIIDPEGNIVSADATRPSDAGIESTLDALDL